MFEEGFLMGDTLSPTDRARRRCVCTHEDKTAASVVGMFSMRTYNAGLLTRYNLHVLKNLRCLRDDYLPQTRVLSEVTRARLTSRGLSYWTPSGASLRMYISYERVFYDWLTFKSSGAPMQWKLLCEHCGFTSSG